MQVINPLLEPQEIDSVYKELGLLTQDERQTGAANAPKTPLPSAPSPKVNTWTSNRSRPLTVRKPGDARLAKPSR
jgi:hypothetical protein